VNVSSGTGGILTVNVSSGTGGILTVNVSRGTGGILTVHGCWAASGRPAESRVGEEGGFPSGSRWWRYR
jgi:hypothetical protein